MVAHPNVQKWKDELRGLQEPGGLIGVALEQSHKSASDATRTDLDVIVRAAQSIQARTHAQDVAVSSLVAVVTSAHVHTAAITPTIIAGFEEGGGE